MRYVVGFPDKGTACALIDRNPGYIPVVEIGGVWVLGRVICLCENEFEAKLVCDLLNLNRQMHSMGWIR